MAAVIRASATYASGANTTTTVGVPGSTANGDGLIAFVSDTGGSGITVTPPAGWTSLGRYVSGTALGFEVFWKVASSEAGSWVWTFSGSSAVGTVVVVIEGSDQITPSDAVNGQATESSKVIVAPSVNLTYANELLLAGFLIAVQESVTLDGVLATVAGDQNVGFSLIVGSQQAVSGVTGTRSSSHATASVGCAALVGILDSRRVVDALEEVQVQDAQEELVVMT